MAKYQNFKKKANNFKKPVTKRKINKYPKGVKKLFFGEEMVTLQFDKNGGLCDVQPRIGDIFNTYKGRTRCFIYEISQILKNYYGNAN